MLDDQVLLGPIEQLCFKVASAQHADFPISTTPSRSYIDTYSPPCRYLALLPKTPQGIPPNDQKRPYLPTSQPTTHLPPCSPTTTPAARSGRPPTPTSEPRARSSSRHFCRAQMLQVATSMRTTGFWMRGTAWALGLG